MSLPPARIKHLFAYRTIQLTSIGEFGSVQTLSDNKELVEITDQHELAIDSAEFVNRPAMFSTFLIFNNTA